MSVHLMHNAACLHRALAVCGATLGPEDWNAIIASRPYDCLDCKAARRADGLSCCADYNPPAGVPLRGRRGKPGARHR